MDAADIISGVRLLRRRYFPADNPEENENRSEDYVLVLPLDHGRIKLERDGAVVHDGPVQPGTLWIVPPGGYSRTTPGTAFEAAVFMVPEQTFRRAACAHKFPVDRYGRLNIRPVMQARYDLRRLVPLLRTTSELRQPRRSMLISGVILTLVALVLDVDAHHAAEQTSGFEDEQFETAIAFAKSRLSEHLDLAEWADCVKLSMSEFARRFQQHTGVAPYTWFMDRRIDEAKRLMTESKMSLVEIALDSGFCSQSHFTEAFRRRVGTSPGRWRAAQSENKNITAAAPGSRSPVRIDVRMRQTDQQLDRRNPQGPWLR
jgi:AraC-like DNA-binding protein